MLHQSRISVAGARGEGEAPWPRLHLFDQAEPAEYNTALPGTHMKSGTIRRVVTTWVVAAAWTATSPSPALAQSFDCAKAATAVEKLICADSQLSKLDERMAQAFVVVRGKVDATVIGQVAWLKAVRNPCTTVDCLKRVYAERIAHLTDLVGRAPVAVFPIDGLAGEWMRVGSSRWAPSSLTIEKVTESGFAFTISAQDGANTGEFEGVARRTAARAIFTDDDTKCRLTFTRKGARLAVATSPECHAMGGMGVAFNGEYAKGNVEPESLTLTALGVLAKNVSERAFSQLVGKDYELFLSSFHLVGESADLDRLGAKVVSGGVRGLFTQMEAIVMSRPDGKIYAAVIDAEHDVVKYFSNDASFKGKLPLTIEDWRQRFLDKKVIYASAK